jgi:hypothetical protein
VVALTPKRRAADPFAQEWYHGASFHYKQIKTKKNKYTVMRIVLGEKW